MNEIKIIKFIAPKILSVNGHPSPCECDDNVTCAYCVQASLTGFGKKLKGNDERKKKIISHIKKNGIRKTAKEIDAQPSTVQYWFRTENFPQWVLNKYACCTNEHSTLHTP
jgi:ferritin